jgi:hypothetical protein
MVVSLPSESDVVSPEVLLIRYEALAQRVRPAEPLKPGRDLGVVQVGIVAAVAVHTHLITCRSAIPLMLRTATAHGTYGLVVEMTDGTSDLDVR